MKAEMGAEHAWLRALVGEWHVEFVMMDGIDQPPGTLAGRETVRMLGDVWLLCEGEGQMPDGGRTRHQMLLGYDPAQGSFVGSFITSAMNHHWVYRSGALDPARRVLALDCEGPSFDGSSGLVSYRDEIEILGPAERLLHGNRIGPDGQWLRFMTSRYWRAG